MGRFLVHPVLACLDGRKGYVFTGGLYAHHDPSEEVTVPEGRTIEGPDDWSRLCDFHQGALKASAGHLLGPDYLLGSVQNRERMKRMLLEVLGDIDGCRRCECTGHSEVSLRLPAVRFGNTPRMPPSTDHEHRWDPAVLCNFTLGKAWTATSASRCSACGMVVRPDDRFEADAFLHTCKGCKKQFRDSSPYNVHCSEECSSKERREIDSGMKAASLSWEVTKLERQYVGGGTLSPDRIKTLKRELESLLEGEPQPSRALLAMRRLDRLGQAMKQFPGVPASDEPPPTVWAVVLSDEDIEALSRGKVVRRSFLRGIPLGDPEHVPAVVQSRRFPNLPRDWKVTEMAEVAVPYDFLLRVVEHPPEGDSEEGTKIRVRPPTDEELGMLSVEERFARSRGEGEVTSVQETGWAAFRETPDGQWKVLERSGSAFLEYGFRLARPHGP